MERAKQYNIISEIEKVARALGLRKFIIRSGLINSLLKSMMKLEKQIGKNKSAYINVSGKKIRDKEGLPIEVYVGRISEIQTITKDILGNEIYITRFHFEDHLKDSLKEDYEKARSILFELFRSPDYVFKDKKENAIMYGKFDAGEHKYYFAVVGLHTRRFYTVVIRKSLFKNLERYIILFKKGDEQ